MNTFEACELLQQQHNGWNIDGPRGVLRHLNDAQRILMRAKHFGHMILDGGKLPELVTTTGTTTYELGSGVWMCDGVYIEHDDDALLLEYQDYGRQLRSIRSELIAGTRYLRVERVLTTPKTRTAEATVEFSADPGDYTFAYKAFVDPAELVSVSIPLTINEPHDTMFLLPAASMLITGIEQNRFIEARAAILNEIRPAYLKELGKDGDQGISFDPVPGGM